MSKLEENKTNIVKSISGVLGDHGYSNRTMQTIIYLGLFAFGCYMVLDGFHYNYDGINFKITEIIGLISFVCGLYGLCNERYKESDKIGEIKANGSNRLNYIIFGSVGLILLTSIALFIWPSKCNYNIEMNASPNLEINGGFNTTLQNGSTFNDEGRQIGGVLQNPLTLHLDNVKVSSNNTKMQVSGQMFCRDISIASLIGRMRNY